MNARALAAVLLLLAGCKAPSEPPAPAANARVLVHIDFEPALPAPAELHYAHECGESGRVMTACAAVELSLPQGPVVFSLVLHGERRELALRVQPAMLPVVWNVAR